MAWRPRTGGPAAMFFVVAAACACGFGRAAGPEDVRAGTLIDEPCEAVFSGSARCARLYVFEDRKTGSGRIIPLRIRVLRAQGSRPESDPVFFLAGGPGQAATTLARGYARVFQGLHATRDLVFVDQRGTGGSHALMCRFYGPPDDPHSYFDRFLPPAKVRECRERLERGADLTQYTTTNAVEDLEQVRAALGFERINLVGGSYGTRLAMEYVRRYESRVRSVILDGAVSPASHMPENFGRLAHRALDLLLEECEADNDCGRAFPAIRNKARTVFERLSAGPVRATVAHPRGGRAADVTLTRSHVAEAIRYMTYSAADAARVPLYLNQAYHGNYAPLAAFLIRWRANGMFDGLYLSITCTEDVPFVSADAEQRDADTYLGAYRVREQRAACEEWRRGDAPAWLRQPVAAKVPVLLISGALDPVTAPAEAVRIMRTLPAARHIVIPFGAHASEGLTGIGCVAGLREAFITRGRADGLDTACVSRITRPGFVLSQ